MPSIRRIACLALTATALFTFSCSESKPAMHVVRGQVLLNDKPLPEALVVLHPHGGNKPVRPNGYTDAQGRYEISTMGAGSGAEAGSYDVTVEWRELRQAGEEKLRDGRNLLPPRYADPNRSGLKCAVHPGINELPPFRLQDR